MTSASILYGADNEIFIDQSGATSNLDIEQVGGSGNIIGGADAAAGSMTALDIDGASMTLDVLQKGSTNKFLGDIWADNYTGYFSFIGDTNTFNMSTDETNATGADGSNVNVQVTGNTNTMTLNHAMTALAANLDYLALLLPSLVLLGRSSGDTLQKLCNGAKKHPTQIQPSTDCQISPGMGINQLAASVAKCAEL